MAYRLFRKSKKIIIDASEFTDRDSAHAVIRVALVPEGEPYGNNLDALHDVLTVIFGRTDIIINNFSAAESSLGDYATAMRRVFTDSADENRNLRIIIND